jgi:hypothetical protein
MQTISDHWFYVLNSTTIKLLIPAEKNEQLKNLTSEESIKSFAKEMGIHSGIVVGRLQHKKIIPWGCFNSLKVKYDIKFFLLKTIVFYVLKCVRFHEKTQTINDHWFYALNSTTIKLYQ